MNFRGLLGVAFLLFALINQLSLGVDFRFRYETPDPKVSERLRRSFGQEL